MMVSPCKDFKKMKAFTEDQANDVLNGEALSLMLLEHSETFINMVDYVKDLLQNCTSTDTSPWAILKTLLLEGWLDDEVRISTTEGDRILIWKQIKS